MLDAIISFSSSSCSDRAIAESTFSFSTPPARPLWPGTPSASRKFEWSRSSIEL